MCSRIFNSLNPHHAVTGRNMNWPFTLDARLYTMPKGIVKSGLSTHFCETQDIDPQRAFTWQARYASVVSILFGEHQKERTVDFGYRPYSGFEYASADGLNEMGLAVNALADVDTDYGSYQEKDNLLSTLRWAQYVLDQFANVAEALEVLRAPEYTLVNQGMPDSSGNPAVFHLCLSDAFGDSAIVEYRDGQPVIYHDRAFCVASNQPDYAAQQTLNAYWQFQWGQSELAVNKAPLYTAPGGFAPTQLFERASFLNTFCVPFKSLDNAIAQTRSMMLANSVPLQFNTHKFAETPGAYSYTIWTNLAANQSLQYYFINGFTMNSVYLKASNIEQCQFVDVMNADLDEQGQFQGLNGDMSALLKDADTVPFAREGA